MNTQFNYLDANSPYVGVGRHIVSASRGYPYSYEQKPVVDRLTDTQWRDLDLHAPATQDYWPVNNMMCPTAVVRSFDGYTTSDVPYGQVSTKYTVEEAWRLYIRDMQCIDLNYRSSATPFNMPVSNTVSSGDQYGTLHVQEDVSRFYPSADNLQYAGPPSNMPMDGKVGYPAGYPQPSYTAPQVCTWSEPYATSDIHNSAHLHGYGRTSGDSTEADVPAYNTATYGISPLAQLQSFGNSLPKETKSIGGNLV